MKNSSATKNKKKTFCYIVKENCFIMYNGEYIGKY